MLDRPRIEIVARLAAAMVGKLLGASPKACAASLTVPMKDLEEILRGTLKELKKGTALHRGVDGILYALDLLREKVGDEAAMTAWQELRKP